MLSAALSLLSTASSEDPLHIPDGFLSLPVALFFWVLSVAIIVLALSQATGTLTERTIPLVGVMAAFIFAAQMINFPIAGGTSGHLLGGTLAAILLGPWAGTMVMVVVIGIQALIFQDGGLGALGANWFNMGITTSLLGYLLFAGLTRVLGVGHRSMLVSSGIAGWITVMVAATLTALQLAASGTSPLGIALPALGIVHIFIGLGEALITAAALAFIATTRRDLLQARWGKIGGAA